MTITKLTVVTLAAATLLAQARFDYLVRNDIFAGLAGNAEAMKRGMEACEKVLAENPNDPEALVWHGLGLFAQGGEEMQGNQQQGMTLVFKGIGEMDRAVSLAPDSVGVRIPRGAALMTAAREMPDSPFRQGLLENARGDFQRAFDLQQDHLSQLGTHPLGELLQGLGDVYSRQGKVDDAQKYYGMIQTMLQDTEYARRAAAWMETRQPLPAAQTGCVGCHTGK